MMNETRSENITISFAPWVEQLMKAQQLEVHSTDLPAKYTQVKDPAVLIGEVQVDRTTGKKYKIVTTESGRKIRVPVEPINDPDEPLYTQDEINRMGDYLLHRKGNNTLKKLRDYAYFVFSINTWRRAGDNLELTIGDVLNEDKTFKQELIIRREQKTGKKTATPINSAVRDALTMYLNARGKYKLTDLLFPANKSGGKMTVDGMCLALKRAAKALGLKQKIGTHSLRKTGAYHYVMRADDKPEAEREVSDIFGHSSILITRRYLMIERETLIKNFEERQLVVELSN